MKQLSGAEFGKRVPLPLPTGMMARGFVRWVKVVAETLMAPRPTATSQLSAKTTGADFFELLLIPQDEMKLFLTSSGIDSEIKDDFLSLLPTSPNQIKVAFIPAASYPESDPWYVAKSLMTLQSLGFKTEEVDLRIENLKSLTEKLSATDVIYVDGGNTFYLLDWVKRSGFDKALKDLISTEKVYVGVSAGSYIACPTIEMANCKGRDRNAVGLTDLTGLNLVPFLLTAHYAMDYETSIRQGSIKSGYPAAALSDGQAVLVDGEKVKVVGPGQKYFFNGFKETVAR